MIHKDAEELERKVIRFVEEKGMTISNLRDCMKEVEEYMCKNATLNFKQGMRPHNLWGLMENRLVETILIFTASDN